jgi:serine/threonine protein kinase
MSGQSDVDTIEDAFGGHTKYCPACFEAFPPLCEVCPDDGTELVVGEQLAPRYRIIGTLAEGGMGIIYDGIQLPIHRPVAIKVMRDDLGRHPDHARRFLREARMLTRISHPNVVNMLDYGETEDGRLYVVLERLRGRTLEAALFDDGKLSVRRTCEIALQISDALVTAHAQGVIHRDLKPSNIILLTELDDWVKVLDFGLAKLTDDDTDAANDITFHGTVVGTPLYMAPEAVRCDAADPRTDLYALGCMVHEMLTGETAFGASSSNLVLVRQLDDPPPPLPAHVPAALRILVERLLAKSPADRPHSAIEVRERFAACLASELAVDEVLTLTHAALPAVISRR